MRRKLQEQAAEKRRLENENRGIKDPDKVRRNQLKAEELERRENEAARMGGGQPTLKVSLTTNNKFSICKLFNAILFLVACQLKPEKLSIYTLFIVFLLKSVVTLL